MSTNLDAGVSGPDVIAAVDVGSPARGSIGWCHLHLGIESTGRDLDELADLIGHNLSNGCRVALGFEAPLFVPMADTSTALCKARNGEGDRAWSASGGLMALGIATQEVTYVLTRIAASVTTSVSAGLDAAGLEDPAVNLVLWEAFVTGKSKDRVAPEPHIADARAAVNELVKRLGSGDVRSDVPADAVFSLVGAAILRANLSTDLQLLNIPCLVIKAPILTTL